jgi:arsenate reductase
MFQTLNSIIEIRKNMKVFGMTTCVRTQKALEWFRHHEVAFVFHDIRKWGLSEQQIRDWDCKVGYRLFLNTHIQTWKNLYPKERAMTEHKEFALSLMHQKLALIKRPVIESNEVLMFGFDEQRYTAQFLKEESHNLNPSI